MPRVKSPQRPPAKESAIVTSITKALRAQGWFVTKLHGGPMQQAGLPDLLALKSGRVAFLEVKRPGERPTPLQAHTLETLRSYGATALVVTSADEAVNLCRAVVL